eukprot:CAMPEP_0182859022 /NCGR_PEP_ID=MMETSP0034_2-20130328/4027_1 /TAXON_ID=156128 /ORGANISM="Nephroselmis pyriformis, Strain CCMP717" /LENGTH=249 /DNA_ID=CAMNT_0024990539 /DNA_START=66 /DNA_END=815 /DNA_ORIENTATION=+
MAATTIRATAPVVCKQVAARDARASACAIAPGRTFLAGSSVVAMRSTVSRATRSPLVVRAATDDDEEEAFENRLANLRKVAGNRVGEGKKAQERVEKKDGVFQKREAKKVYDFTNETTFYEGSPSNGDVATNIALGITLVWLPLTLASIARKITLEYKITDKRVSIIRNAPWEEENRVDVAYPEITDVIVVGRGVGLWGDMVITLRDGSKVELRSVEKFMEIRDYIRARVDEIKASSPGVGSGGFKDKK